MIDLVNQWGLSQIEQAFLFLFSSLFSMLYHYLDRWLEGEERLLVSSENTWRALKILGGLLIGSSIWTNIYTLTNMEVLIAGIALGFMAFNRGVAEIKDKDNVFKGR